MTSFWDKFTGGIEAFGGATWAPVGLVSDVVTAPWHSNDQFNGFLATVKHDTEKRWGQFTNPTSAPSHWGQVAGEVATDTGFNEAMKGADWLRSNVVSRPLSTAITAGELNALSDDPTALFKADTWRKAYKIADHRSPGQAAALGIMGGVHNIDILNPDELKQAQDRAWYKWSSGFLDAAASVFLDPTVGAASGLGAARKVVAVRPAHAGGAQEYLVSRHWNDFANWALGKSAQEISAHKAVARSDNPMMVASLLSQAKNRDQIDLVGRIAHGDGIALDQLRNENELLADAIGNQLQPTNPILQSMYEQALGPDWATMFNDPARLEDVNKKLEGLAQDRGALANVAGSMSGSLPSSGIGQLKAAEFRAKFRSGEVFQNSLLNTPLRVISWAGRAAPNGWVDLNRTDAHTRIDEMFADTPGFDQATREKYVARVMNARDDGQRFMAIHQAQAAGLRHVLGQYGATEDDVRKVLGSTMQKRDQMMSKLQSRSYSPAEYQGRMADIFMDDGEPVHMPILPEELANRMPLMDLGRLDKLLKRNQNVIAARVAHRGEDFATAAGDSLNSWWKTSVLLRLGYPLRMVTDDQLAIMARFGVMASLLNTSKGSANLVRNNWDRIRIRAGRMEGEGWQARRIGDQEWNYKGNTIEGARQGDANPFPQLVSSEQNVPDFLDGAASKAHGRLAATGAWQTISASENATGHMRAWLHSINNRFGNNELAKQIIAGKSDPEIMNWLTTTPAGIQYRKSVRWWKDPADLLGRTRSTVDHIVPDENGLRQLVSDKKFQVTEKELTDLYPDAARRPTVNGDVLDYNTGTHGVLDAVHRFRDWAMRGLASQPTDVLSRHPTFDALYRQRMKQLVDVHETPDGLLDNGVLSQFQRQSREYALRETNRLLIDISAQSNLAHMFRYISPFFGANQQALARWAGVIADNPAVLRRFDQVWNSPNQLGLVVDENGDPVPPHSPMKDTYSLQFQLPLPVAKGLGIESTRKVRISKNSFNFSLQGQPWWNPGFGPFVQVPANKILIGHPGLADTALAKFIMPYGPKRSTLDLIKSTTMLRGQALASDDDDVTRAAEINIMQTELTNWRLGKRDKAPTLAEVHDRAFKLKALRFLSAWVMPAQPRFLSPYQFYADQYHKLRQQDFKTADEKFYDQHPEYFAFATSVSKNNTGIPASIAATKAQRKYADLIAENPELGGLIVGPEGGGQFQQAAYYYQLNHTIGPGSSTTFRAKQTPEEFVRANHEQEGWIKFSKLMNQLEAQRIDRGLTKMSDDGGEDLLQSKQQFLEQMAKDNPDWLNDYSTRNANAIPDRINAMKEISTDPRILKNPERTEMATLRQYLAARDGLQEELNARADAGGAKTLTAAENSDLKETWDSLVGGFIAKDPRFQDLFYRYLEHDILQG